MKKYMAIVKKTAESMTGVSSEILTRFSDDKCYLKKWFELFPNSKKLVLDNNQELQTFFEDFEELTPITDSEKKKAEVASNELRLLMNCDLNT